MENRDLFQAILQRADDATLAVLSRTPLWTQIKPLLEDQNYWFQRTQSLVDLPPELSVWEYGDNSKQDWHQIYNIIAVTRDGANPFETDILALNGYNYIAMKWLLDAGKYDPSVEDSDALQGAAGIGTPETVQLLLSDSRIDPLVGDTESVIGARWAIVRAAVDGRVDNIEVLLADDRIQAELATPAGEKIKSRALIGAALQNKPEVVILLLSLWQYKDFDLQQAMLATARRDSLEALTLLYETESSRTDIGFWRVLVAQAAEHGSTRILDFLLDEQWIAALFRDPDDLESLFDTAISNDQVNALISLSRKFNPGYTSSEWLDRISRYGRGRNVIAKALEDEELTRTDIVLAIQNAVTDAGPEVLAVLLSDPRATNISGLLVGLLHTDASREMARVILASDQLELEEVPLQLLQQLTGYNDDLSPVVPRICNDYNKCHVEVLLRELVVKQRDYIYYLDWLIDRMQRPTTRPEVRDLISGAATAVLTTEPTVHTSPEFTAYYGFFLFGTTESASLVRSSPQGAEARKRDVALILDTLRLDADVTRDGIERAEKLLQALQLDSD